MVRHVRISVADKISGAVHYIAQVTDTTVGEVYGCLMMSLVEDNTMADLAVTVKDKLPRYRLGLTEDLDVAVRED